MVGARRRERPRKACGPEQGCEMTAQAAPPAPEDEIPEERQFLGVPVRNAHRKNRANLTAELLAVARSLDKTAAALSH